MPRVKVDAELSDGAWNDGAETLIQRRKIIIKEGIRKTKRREEISGRRVRRRRRRLRRRGRKKGRKRRKVRKVERGKESSNFSRKNGSVRICTE